MNQLWRSFVRIAEHFPRTHGRPNAIKASGLALAFIASFSLQPPTAAEAAALWTQSANTQLARLTQATPKPNPDPAYQPPQKHGVSYTAPPLKTAPANGSPGAEKLKLRTQNSRTFAGSGRQLTTFVYADSINYRDQSGAWQAIDDSLVKSNLGGYAYQNKSNRYAVYLPADISGAPIRIASGANWLTFTVQGARATSSVSGSVATYSNALPGVTVIVDSRPDTVEESLVLQGPTALSQFSYQLQMSPGLRVKASAQSLAVVDSSGKAVFGLAAPAMYDSAKGGGAHSWAITFAPSQDSKGTTLTLKADPTWLGDKARKWPVTIDPTFIVGDVRDCYINAGSPTTKFCGGTSLNAGFDGTSASRALLQFDLSPIPMTDSVVSSKLLMYLGSTTTSTAASLSVYQLTRTWTANATWSTYDGTNSWTTAGGDFSSTAAATTNNISATGAWYTWSPTALVQGWVNGSIVNNGLIVKEPTENVTNVFSFNSSTGTNPPYLQIVHQQGGAIPASYSTTVLADHPVAYWRMDDTTGTTMVDTQGVDSGNYNQAYTLGQPSLIQPASGTSVSFNSSGGYATAPTLTTLQGDNTRSIELWFQTSTASFMTLFDAGAAAGSSNQMFSLMVVPQGWAGNNPPNGISLPGLYVALWSQDIYFPMQNLEDGKRHHVVLELSGNNIWLYVDNTTPEAYFTSQGGMDNFAGNWGPNRYLVQQPITLTTTPNTAANQVMIGWGRYANLSLNGKMDEVAVYSTALTATQVQNHWQAGNGLPWTPTALSATPGQNQVTLSWTAPTFNGSAITGYVITPQIGANARTPLTFNSAATSETISNLSGGSSYSFTVSAFNSLGMGLTSAASGAATPTGAALPLYEETVLADSPVGFWPLGETSGNIATDLTQTADGLYLGGYTQGDAGPVVNYANKAANLNGTYTHIRLNHTTLLEPGAVTVEAWIKPSSIPAGDTTVLIAPQPGNNEWGSSGYVLIFDGSTNGHPGQINFGGITSSSALPTGAWSYVVATIDSAAIRIYINGKQSQATTTTGPSYGGAPNFDAQITKYGFPGDVADVAIYSSALSKGQIAAHYAVAGYAPGPVSNLVASASTNSASLTWTVPAYTGTSPISSYTVTPIVDGKASTPITIGGNGSGANIPNLPGGASYTFQVQANNASGAGIIVTSSAVTIASPAAGPGSFGTYLFMKGGPGQGQAYSHYGFVSRNNVPAMSTWTLEERLWSWNSLSVTGGHAALGLLSGTPSNPTDQSPIAGLNFNIGGSPLQTYFVWPGGGSCTVPSDVQGLPSAFDNSITTPAHVALSYDGTTVRGFINGTLVAGCSVATAGAAVPAAPFGLMDNSGLNQAAFDEFRVSNTARYTANFTPPTQQFTTDANTMILWRFNDYPISKLPSTQIYPAQNDGAGYLGGIIPSTYRDSSGNTNHANTIWASGNGVVTGASDWRRPYSLGQGVTADELTGGETPWLCPCTISSTARPVNDATGEFYHTFADFHVAGRIDLDFTRTYSSLRTATLGPTGYGWTDNYNQYLTFDGSGNATMHAANGSGVVFTFTAPNTYSGPPSEHVTLVKNADSTFTLTDAGQNQTVFNPASGNLSTLKKIVDRHGAAAYTLTMAYNPDGTLASVTDPNGRSLTFAYTTIGTAKLIQTVTQNDSPSRSVSFLYGTNSADATTYLSLTQVNDVANGLTKFTYDSNHYLLTMTDPNNGVTTNTYDSTTHQVTKQQEPITTRSTTFTYSGGITTITDPKGNQTQEEYLNGILLSRTIGYGTAQAATWTYSFDPAAVGLTASVGPNGETTTTVRNANANVLSQTDGLGRTTNYTFSEPLTIQDPTGVTTTNTYNATGDLATTSRPLVGAQQVQTITYNHADSAHPGDVTSMVDADSKTWTYTYDANGYRTSVSDPLGNKTTNVFNSDGWMTSMVTPNGNVSGGNPANFTWTYTYDPFGNRTSVKDPLGHQTNYHFDPNQNLDRVTDANGNLSTNVYDADNERTQVKRADSPQTTLTTDYNADGTVLDQKDGKNNAIQTYAYDSLAHVTSVTDALNNVTTYVYDAYGNMLSKQDPGGNCSAAPATGCTTYSYDAANQLTAISYSDGVTPNVSNLTYDGDGQRLSMTDGTGTSTFGWDSLHRMVSYQNGNGTQVQWVYNLRNLATTIVYPGSLSVTRGYDAAGRWTSVQDWNSNLTTFGYDANSNLTTETLPSASGVVDSFSFNAADQVTAISDTKIAVPLFTASYTRDSLNQLTGDTSASPTSGSFKYTSLNQLCYAGAANVTACSSPPPNSIAYAYDAADNLTQKGSNQQAFNNSDELCWTASTSAACGSPPSGATTYQYDTRGNRTNVSPNGGQAQTLTFDQANRLTKFAAASTTSYGYNGDGLRMCKYAGSSTQPCQQGGAAQYLWDVAGSLPLVIKDGTTAYVYGPENLPLEQVNGGTTYWLHHDQIGSTRLVTDSTGTSQATYTYDPYGSLVSSTGSVLIPFRYNGQYQDPESGLYYLRARYYEPATAQFISLDPNVGETREPYGYVQGGPLVRDDPSGLNWWDNVKRAGASLVGSVHQAVISQAQHIEDVAGIMDVTSAGFGFLELGCGAVGLAAAALGPETEGGSLLGDIPAAACVAYAGFMSEVTLAEAGILHAGACWGNNHRACENMVIDGFTLAIAWAGGKAFESIGEALGYREAILSVCDAIGNGIADGIKKVITGGGANFPEYGL